MVRNSGLAAVFIVINCGAKDLFGDIQGFLLIKFNMRGTLDFNFLGCSNDLGMEILGQPNYSLHDALDIHHHGFHRTGQDS